MKKAAILISIAFLSLTLNAQNGDYIQTNGVKIYYETYGEGEPLLLLHGFTMTHKAWEPWIEDLAKTHKLIVPDQRGHGNSTNPEKVYTHKLSAMDMYGLMDALHFEQFDAIGHSSGAMTLIHMATMDTSRISSMALISGTSYFPEQSRVNTKNTTYETIDDGWKNYLGAIHPGGEEQIKMLINQFHSFSTSYDDMNFTPAYLGTIRSATFIIHGDRDHHFPIDIPVTFYESIPKSYLWIVPNDGHFPAGIYERNSIWSDVMMSAMDEFFSGKWE